MRAAMRPDADGVRWEKGRKGKRGKETHHEERKTLTTDSHGYTRTIGRGTAPSTLDRRACPPYYQVTLGTWPRENGNTMRKRAETVPRNGACHHKDRVTRQRSKGVV